MVQRRQNLLTNALLRIGLLSAGALLLYTAFRMLGTAPMTQTPADTLLVVGCGAAGFVVAGLAGLRRLPGVLRWLILAAFIAQLLLLAQTWWQTSGLTWIGNRLPKLVQTDASIYTDMAAALFLRGHNPYDWDYSGALSTYRVSNTDGTATLKGNQEGPYSYPALAFLLVTPFEVIGLPGSFALLVVAHLLLLILLFTRAARLLQPIILLPLALGNAINWLALTYLGVMEIVWVTLIIAMIAAWRRPVLRALLWGLAIAYKQQVWLLLPFLLIRIWCGDDGDTEVSRWSRLKRTMQFVLISGGMFVLINLLFFLAAPGIWLRNMLEPLTDSLVLFSQGGLSSLTQFGFVNLPKNYFLLATGVVLVVLAICYWRHYASLRESCWLLPGVFMWFSYRSLISYWIYWLLPMLAALTLLPPVMPVISQVVPRFIPDLSGAKRWRQTLVGVLATALGLLVIGINMAEPSAIAVNVQLPIQTDASGRVSEIVVQIANHSPSTLTPRIAIEHAGNSDNPIPWYIESGPTRLLPGQAGIYHALSSGDATSFVGYDPAQLIVTDADQNYSFRGVATIAPEPSFLWPDAIPNPQYRYWADDQPLLWTLQPIATDSASRVSVALVEKEGKQALALTLAPIDNPQNSDPPLTDATSDANGNYGAELATQVSFPLNPFGVWLYLDPTTLGTAAAGIEIDDGAHVLRWQVNPTALTNPADSSYTINLNLPAGKWTFVTLDLPRLYAQAGWPTNDLSHSVYRAISADFKLITLKFFLSASSSMNTAATPKLTAYFGPIDQPDYMVKPETYMDATLTNPTSYYVRLGDSYLQNASYQRAIDMYRRALDFSPANADAQTRLDQAQKYRAAEYGQ